MQADGHNASITNKPHRTCRGDAPKLDSLSLVLMNAYSYGRPTPTVKLALTTPRLRSVMLHGLELEWGTIPAAETVVIPTPRLQFPWSLFNSLRELTITSENDFPLNTGPDMPYGLPLLPTLQQLVIPKAALGAALQINMPSLRTLLVHKGDFVLPNQPWEFAPFRSFHPLPSLTKFVLGSRNPTASPFLIYILGLMPKLVTLKFDGACPEDLFFYQMADNSLSKEPVCPYLKHLTIWGAARDPSASVGIFVQVSHT